MAASARNAERTGGRLTPSGVTRWRSGGRRSPARRWPRPIKSRTWEITCSVLGLVGRVAIWRIILPAEVDKPPSKSQKHLVVQLTEVWDRIRDVPEMSTMYSRRDFAKATLSL